MGMTPEGRVKSNVRKLFSLWGDEIYHFWPVQSGWGSATLDILGCANGHFFAIETKQSKKDLTDRQDVIRTLMGRSHAKVFRVRDHAELEVFKDWLYSVLGAPPDNLGG